MNFIRKSFGRKLALVYGIVFFIVFAGAFIYSSHLVAKEALAELEDSMTLQASLMARILTPYLIEKKGLDELARITEELGNESKTRVTVINPDGVVLADSDIKSDRISGVENHKDRPEIRAAFKGSVGAELRFSKTLNQQMLYVALPLTAIGNGHYVLRLALPFNAVNKILHSLGRPLLVSFVTGIVFVIIFSSWMSRSITKQVGHLAEVAKQYTAGDLTRKTSIRSGDELEVLGKSMNQMAVTIKERIGEIEKEKAQFAGVLNHMTEGVIAVDAHHQVLLVNPSAERIFNIHRQIACGRSFIEAIRNQKIDAMMSEAIRTQSLISTEIELPQMEAKFLRVSALGISKLAGEVAGILVISDVSEVRRLENVRREFVANVSHELRTPLTSIRGFIETLLGGALSDPTKNKEFLKMMEEDAARLSKLVEDLLELSSIEAKQTTFKSEPLSLEKEANQAANLLRLHLDGKKIDLKIEIGNDLRVSADPNGLKQVFMNLLDNAIKFNQEKGQIVLHAVRLANQVKVSIQDSGCGIPEDAISRIFERFYRVDKARSRKLGGTGLGLAIVKHIVEAHGGKVWCESELDKGSTFFFTLPKA